MSNRIDSDRPRSTRNTSAPGHPAGGFSLPERFFVGRLDGRLQKVSSACGITSATRPIVEAEGRNAALLRSPWETTRRRSRPASFDDDEVRRQIVETPGILQTGEVVPTSLRFEDLQSRPGQHRQRRACARLEPGAFDPVTRAKGMSSRLIHGCIPAGDPEVRRSHSPATGAGSPSRTSRSIIRHSP